MEQVEKDIFSTIANLTMYPQCALCGLNNKENLTCHLCARSVCRPCVVTFLNRNSECKQCRLAPKPRGGLVGPKSIVGPVNNYLDSICLMHLKNIVSYCATCHQSVCEDCLEPDDDLICCGDDLLKTLGYEKKELMLTKLVDIDMCLEVQSNIMLEIDRNIETVEIEKVKKIESLAKRYELEIMELEKDATIELQTLVKKKIPIEAMVIDAEKLHLQLQNLLQTQKIKLMFQKIVAIDECTRIGLLTDEMCMRRTEEKACPATGTLALQRQDLFFNDKEEAPFLVVVECGYYKCHLYFVSNDDRIKLMVDLYDNRFGTLIDKDIHFLHSIDLEFTNPEDENQSLKYTVANMIHAFQGQSYIEHFPTPLSKTILDSGIIHEDKLLINYTVSFTKDEFQKEKIEEKKKNSEPRNGTLGFYITDEDFMRGSIKAIKHGYAKWQFWIEVEKIEDTKEFHLYCELDHHRWNKNGQFIDLPSSLDMEFIHPDPSKNFKQSFDQIIKTQLEARFEFSPNPWWESAQKKLVDQGFVNSYGLVKTTFAANFPKPLKPNKINDFNRMITPRLPIQHLFFSSKLQPIYQETAKKTEELEEEEESFSDVMLKKRAEERGTPVTGVISITKEVLLYETTHLQPHIIHCGHYTCVLYFVSAEDQIRVRVDLFDLRFGTFKNKGFLFIHEIDLEFVHPHNECMNITYPIADLMHAYQGQTYIEYFPQDTSDRIIQGGFIEPHGITLIKYSVSFTKQEFIKPVCPPEHRSTFEGTLVCFIMDDFQGKGAIQSIVCGDASWEIWLAAGGSHVGLIVNLEIDKNYYDSKGPVIELPYDIELVFKHPSDETKIIQKKFDHLLKTEREGRYEFSSNPWWKTAVQELKDGGYVDKYGKANIDFKLQFPQLEYSPPGTPLGYTTD